MSAGSGGGGSPFSTSSSSGGQAAQGAGSTAAGIGDKVRDGKFEFVVTKISHAKSVGDTSVGLGDTAQGRYTILHITVTNIGSEAQTLDDSSQYFYDAAERKFSASSEADIDLAGANGQNSTWLEDINPGNTVHGPDRLRSAGRRQGSKGRAARFHVLRRRDGEPALTWPRSCAPPAHGLAGRFRFRSAPGPSPCSAQINRPRARVRQ